MFVDIALQQQLPEVFSTNRNHHRSSSSSSTHKRNTTSSSNTMTNGQRYITDELGKKAEQILGYPTAVVDYRRQPSIDFNSQHPPRLNITDSKSRINNQQVSPLATSNQTIIKNRHLVTVDQLVPLILKLVEPLTYSKLSERTSKRIDNIVESRKTDIKLSDGENEEEEEEEDEKIPNENQNKIQHSDSDMENEDETTRTNPHTLSLSDFIQAKNSPKESLIDHRKRSVSPPTPTKQNKRKQELLRSFSSSVNTPIDIKQPTLPITIPTYLFLEQSSKTEDDRAKTSKRYANGSVKHEPNTDMLDNSTTQHKKSKTSHLYKQEPTTLATSMNIKLETDSFSNAANDIPFPGNMATVAPMIVQPKKEKPTANVKPLLQTTLIDNSSSITSNPNVVNPPDRLTTAANISTRANYAILKNMSTKELNNLAREKKKQADGEKRTFEDVKQSMSLYLESVCYFIQCAHDEPILEQRSTLLTATIAMLQHLAHNYPKMFHISTNQSAESLNNIRPKFLLINYWLQSYIYQLQYNINLPLIERCANQVTEYINHSKSPSDTHPNIIFDFSKYMLNSYHSNYCWNKAERLIREEPSKKFFEQLLRQNQNRRLTRDDTTLDFLLYIFDAIDLLRLTVI